MNAANTDYQGIWPVMVTPYTDLLTIDIPAYRHILEWHLEFETGGIYANCLSSEMYQLNEEERLLLISEAAKVVNGKVPVAATGNFGDTLDEQLDFCLKARDAGADIVMLTVPATVQDDVELERYLFHFAENSDIPLGIYECPFPRHYHLGLELIQKLADSGRFVAYKETSCELDKILSILEITENSKLDLLQANVPFMLEATQAGVPGSMNVVANWLPDLTIEVWKGGRVNDPSVEQLNASLCAMELAQRSVHPSGVKYLMSKRGLPIKPYTRLSKKLTKEEARGLDIVSGMWFQEDGSLTILK